MQLASADTSYLPSLERFNPRVFLAVAAIAAAVYGADLILNLADTIHSSNGELVVVGLRLFVPLLILRFWLVGGVTAMLLDGADVIITDALNMGGFGDHYAELDKVLDTYYLTLELIVALGWRNPWTRIPSLLLFIYRIAGVLLYETTGERIFLFLFPNMFENWWLYCVVVMKWFERIVPHNWRTVWVPMLILLVPKMAQEYVLHFAEIKPYRWTKEHILEPIGLDY